MNYTDTIGRTNKKNACELCGELPGTQDEHHKVNGYYRGKRTHARNLKLYQGTYSEACGISPEFTGKRLCPNCYAIHITAKVDARYNR